MANSESTVQIIPYYAHPHVHTVIDDNSWYDETVAAAPSNEMPYATLCVTGADSGIDNTFVLLNDKATKDAIFGKGNFQKYGQASIQGDVLFSGSNSVWFCRVLPDNATYANVIILAHYRKKPILDELGQETGLSRMEIKFSTAYATKPALTEGALTDDAILAYANSLATTRADAVSGYMTVPICFARSIGRGKYGNMYAMSITRDKDSEKEYGVKMYSFNLLSNQSVTRRINRFVGSIYQSSIYNMSTLISDVLDQYSTGSCPISIHSFEDSFQKLYDFYQNEVVSANATYLLTSGATPEDLEVLRSAQSITEETFDPFFGIVQDSQYTDDKIPYYKNYTMKESGPYVKPDLEIPNTGGATKPLNIANWTNAFVGAHVLVVADPLNNGLRWTYTIMSIDPDTGNIVYDEGEQTEIDADQYDGINIAQDVGLMMLGGHDGDFQSITVNGETRAPSAAEMKLLLSREYVKAFRGEKDRKILSPARVNLDFMFDANYNMTTDETLKLDTHNIPLYNNATVLTDVDSQQLAIAGNLGIDLSFSDINVKQAMYDLNEFRNKNGMTINPEQGAGCSLYLDCNMVGLKKVNVNFELLSIIDSMADFDSRACSVDLGYYEIFEPVTGKRVKVTTSYYIAKNLIKHIVKYGLNKPFVYDYATLRAIQRDAMMTVSGDMIRDTFRPDIDLIDYDVKEKLFKSRINYYLTKDEGKNVQRACQNTRQTDASALLEENNVRVLNTLKKKLEAACTSYLYAWNEPEVRKSFTDAQMKIFQPWIGTMVQDLSIVFKANEWEQERMIMHCYVSVSFRDIIKRIILEININRPTYSLEGGES